MKGREEREGEGRKGRATKAVPRKWGQEREER